MAKSPAKDPYRCAECGWSTAKWVGRCGECQTWGSIEEVSAPKKLSLVASAVTSAARPIGEVSLESAKARSSGVSELDRVLGGGLVPGAAILLAGEPGVGKSTLLLSVAAETAKKNLTSLYISGEESASQVRLRAERLSAIDKSLWLAAESELGAVIAHIDAVKPQLLIIDSIQTITSTAVEGAPGGITQVREIASALIRIAKERAIRLRVSCGRMTSSIYPRRPATKGFANLDLYSASRAEIFSGSDFSSRKIISTAPLGPITAISADGHAKLTSPRKCLEAITS